jgi:hypothetical protein
MSTVLLARLIDSWSGLDIAHERRRTPRKSEAALACATVLR